MSRLPKQGRDSASRRLMPVLFIGVFMGALDTAVIGPAVPALRDAFGVDNREVGLVMSLFILFSLCSTVVMSNLSDQYGRRSVYLSSVACFALGSLLVAVSPRFWMLIVSRAIQGIGAGGITPTASAVVGDAFPPEERGRALGLIGATYGMAFVLGPPLAALLMAASSWRWIFLINVPIAAAVLLLGARVLPARRPEQSRAPLDLSGIVATFLLLACFVLGITRVLDAPLHLMLWPWCLGASAVLLASLLAIERRARQPMIPLSLFANRQLANAYLLALGAGFGMGSVIFLTSIATTAYAVLPRHAGFVLLPLVISSMLGSMGAGRLLHRTGARWLLLIGFALLSAGYAACAVMAFGLWAFLLASVPVGLGLGVVVGGSLRAIAIEEAPAELRATAQGLINIANAIGTLISAAAVSTIADLWGGRAMGFAVAYAAVAVLMLMMMLLTLRLDEGRVAGRRLEPASPP